MLIELTTDGARLVDCDDFAHFVVSSPAAYDDTQIAAVLHDSGAGYLAAGGAVISATWVQAQVEPTTVWLEGFHSMLSYAESRGWLADDGQAIRAHIERSIRS
jgi:hypothetical protein